MCIVSSVGVVVWRWPRVNHFLPPRERICPLYLSFLRLALLAFVTPACWRTDANEKLNGTALPGFASYANSPALTIRRDNFTCPVISGQNVGGGYSTVRLRLDPSYIDYAHCLCVEGMEVCMYTGLVV